MDYAKELKTLAKRADEAKLAMVKCEARLEELNKKRGELLAKCKEKDIDPEKLGELIAEAEAKLEKLLTAIKESLPETNEALF